MSATSEGRNGFRYGCRSPEASEASEEASDDDASDASPASASSAARSSNDPSPHPASTRSPSSPNDAPSSPCAAVASSDPGGSLLRSSAKSAAVHSPSRRARPRRRLRPSRPPLVARRPRLAAPPRRESPPGLRRRLRRLRRLRRPPRLRRLPFLARRRPRLRLRPPRLPPRPPPPPSHLLVQLDDLADELAREVRLRLLEVRPEHLDHHRLGHRAGRRDLPKADDLARAEQIVLAQALERRRRQVPARVLQHRLPIRLLQELALQGVVHARGHAGRGPGFREDVAEPAGVPRRRPLRGDVATRLLRSQARQLRVANFDGGERRSSRRLPTTRTDVSGFGFFTFFSSSFPFIFRSAALPVPLHRAGALRRVGALVLAEHLQNRELLLVHRARVEVVRVEEATRGGPRVGVFVVGGVVLEVVPESVAAEHGVERPTVLVRAGDVRRARAHEQRELRVEPRHLVQAQGPLQGAADGDARVVRGGAVEPGVGVAGVAHVHRGRSGCGGGGRRGAAAAAEEEEAEEAEEADAGEDSRSAARRA